MLEAAMTRAVLAGGPASLTLTDVASTSETINLIDDASLVCDRVTSTVQSAIYGEGEEVGTDFMVKASGTPMLYQPTGSMMALFPFSTVSGSTLSIIPQIGLPVFGLTFGALTTTPGIDATAAWLSPNGDKIVVQNYGVTKPPD